MRLDVDAAAYSTAAKSLLSANGTVALAHGSLTSALSGTAGMGGDDKSSEEFVAGYDRSAQELVAAIADLATAYGTLATVTDASGANHRDANAASVYRGGAAGGHPTAVGGPQQVAASTPPSALGGDAGDAPEFWDMIVDHLQGWAWPSADTGRLRSAAAAWNAAASSLDRTPPCCEVATTQLSAQRSPEIDQATAAISEVSQASTDLATECRSLASACEEYATKVDTTKDVVRGLLKDLAIELGATALIAGAASFVTFGGAALAGGTVAGARAAAYAGRVIAALSSIRAIRAVVTVARTVEKATDVRQMLRRFRSARNLRRRPTGHLPETGKPNSYGYDGAGARLPYANSRPSYGKGQVDEVWERAKNENGEVWVLNKNDELVKIEWEPGQPRRDTWDMGHRPEQEYRTLRDDYMSGKITKEEFLERYRDPDNYTVQDPGRNRSHVDEAAPSGRR